VILVGRPHYLTSPFLSRLDHQADSRSATQKEMPPRTAPDVKQKKPTGHPPRTDGPSSSHLHRAKIFVRQRCADSESRTPEILDAHARSVLPGRPSLCERQTPGCPPARALFFWLRAEPGTASQPLVPSLNSSEPTRPDRGEALTSRPDPAERLRRSIQNVKPEVPENRSGPSPLPPSDPASAPSLASAALW